MEYLRLISEKYNSAIITSIHQPNNDILMKFDTLYVLAKGGICVYSGSSQQLNNILGECQIICKEFQFPIEVLLKIATNGSNNKQVMELAKKTSQENQLILNRCENEGKLFPDGIPFKSKNFKLIDMWYLLLRSMINTYLCQWKLLLIQLCFYISFPLIMTQVFNSDIGTPDGCYSYNSDSNSTCLKQLEDDSVLDQNTKFHFFTTVTALFIQLTITMLTFPTIIKIYMNEHRNSES
jgi:hypothetical protein